MNYSDFLDAFEGMRRRKCTLIGKNPVLNYSSEMKNERI